jgi:RNA polymerase sigma factor (sigma-70 family)
VSGIENAAAIRTAGWPEEKLVKECIRGDQEAWAVLIDRYKSLIYSIPLKYGLSREDASDIFQQVCVQVLNSLPELREPKSLTTWLIRLTSHTCLRWSKNKPQFTSLEAEPLTADLSTWGNPPEALTGELGQEQKLREALNRVAPRCRELIRMLFFEEPAVPYEEVARKLGLAKGSIGFVRMRCLKRLRKILQENSL